MDGFENPTFAAAEKTPGGTEEVEEALVALREIEAFAEPRAVAAIERLIAAKLNAAEHGRRLGSDEAPAEAAVRAISSAMARLSEAPMNWNQAVVHFACEEEDAGRRRWTTLVGAVLVLAQLMVAVSVSVGTIVQSCETNDDCPQAGTFCRGMGTMTTSSRCEYCGVIVPLPLQADPRTGGTLNHPMIEDFVGFNKTLVAEICISPTERFGWDGFAGKNGHPKLMPRSAVASWCESCVNAIDMSVDSLYMESLMRANVAAMAPFDWMAVLLTSFVVALAVIGELKDIELVELALHRVGDKVSPRWRICVWLIGAMRRWIFLPALVVDVPALVLYKGGDALSVCFNCVAVLFLTELDNVAYWTLLSERVRGRVEVDARVELDETKISALGRSKAVHLGLLMVMMPLIVWLCSFYGVFLLPFVAFGLGGVDQALDPAAVASSGGYARNTTGETGARASCKRVTQTTGLWFAGMVVYFAVFELSLSW
jgi:hypothetical protein